FDLYLDAPLCLDILGVNPGREEYGQQLSEELKRAAIGKRQQLDPSKLVVSDTILDAENRLLRLLFASPWLCQELKSAISSDLVSGLVTTSIFNSIATLIENGEELDFAKIRDQIIETESPERVKRCINLLSGSIILASDMESADNEHLRKEAENVLAALKRRKLEQQVSAVQYEINQAQKEGEMEKVTQLSLKKLDLVNQLRQHF
ncbi:MAG: hypothetical protein JNN15_15635, partial [Blastocatellia bacterium]|nr:hypothetical protein [Blastocatellia bacterium]